MQTLRLFVILPLVSLIAAPACVKPPGQVAQGPDAAVDASVDASPPDAAVDAGPQVRQLVQRNLFGATPVDNRFRDPTMARIDFTDWLPFDYSTYELALVFVREQRTPTGLPALGLRRNGNTGTLQGPAKSTSGPIQVSIWVGVFEDQEITSPQIRLLGLYPDGGSSVDLAPDESTPSQTLDGVTWTWWKADIPDGPVGWTTLRIVHRDDNIVFLNGPVLVPAGAGLKSSRSWRPVTRRPFTRAERVNFSEYWKVYRDRF